MKDKRYYFEGEESVEEKKERERKLKGSYFCLCY